jgi:hypothetical protein
MKLDLSISIKLLDQAEYPVEDSMIALQTIGKRYNIPPQQISETIKPALIVSDQGSGNTIALPESPPPGTGNLTLADFCTQYDLSSKLVTRELKEKGITASADLTLKQIASQNQTSPLDLYEVIKNITQN